MKDKPATHASVGGLSGTRSFSGAISELLNASIEVMKNETRIWLLKSLMKKNLATRDIFSFAMKQANLRSINKTPDSLTIRRAMCIKLGDIKLSMTHSFEARRRARQNLLKQLGEKKYILKKHIRNIKREVEEKRTITLEKYRKKIDHYTKTQSILLDNGQNKMGIKKALVPTEPPRSMSDFASLSIFGQPCDLPEPERPLGPFICDPRIVLSKDERLLLSRDPKYSVRTEVDELDFTVELERALSKNRYNRAKISKKKIGDMIKCREEKPLKQTADVAEIFDIENKEHLHVKEIDRLDAIYKIYSENRRRYTYDPFLKTINMNFRRVTDYKLNKNITLPKPLDTDEEFNCERRRRAIMGAFREYKKELDLQRQKKKERFNDNKKGNNTVKLHTDELESGAVSDKGMELNDAKAVHDKNKKTQRHINNLPHKEALALKSLKKRVDNGELVVCQTDKSSRLAVLTLEQYLDSGRVNTLKDKKVNWKDVKYLQGQVNNHVWWISKALGNASKSDPQRMNRNTQSSSMEVPDMVLLLKDHKKWTVDSKEPVPSRPVVSGNRGINTHLSELLADIMEPLASNNIGVEITSTEELLCKFEENNEKFDAGTGMGEVNILEEIASRKDTYLQCDETEQNVTDCVGLF